MSKITKEMMKKIRREVEKEFPDDKMMQELHIMRWHDYLKTKGMSVNEKIEYYNSAERRLKTKPVSK